MSTPAFPYFKAFSLTGILAISLLVALMLGSYHSRSVEIEKASVVLKNRIALDLIDLGLESDSTQITQDNHVVKTYIAGLNNHLAEVKFPLRVNKILHFEADSVGEGSTMTLILQNARNEVPVTVTVVSPWIKWWSLLLPGLFVFGFFTLYSLNTRDLLLAVSLNQKEIVKVPPKLVVDLRDRTLYLDSNKEQSSTLSNKPLCFYLAMLTYCRDTSAPQLFHNKQLPEDFIALANKYFSRLLELGHSRRKRPDFDNNIDKMLSEIRAALEEIMSDEPELKSMFFPQKAQGEGSRSKLHNFALTEVTPESFELIGN